jgi:hypothetical protein
MLVLVKHSTESVASSYVKAGGLVRNHQGHGPWLERAGVRDALMRPVPVAGLPELRRAGRRRDWFQIGVRSASSRWQVCTRRSMIEFILGIWAPLRTTSMPASARMAPNRAGNVRPGL